jgi:hypothetical protein
MRKERAMKEFRMNYPWKEGITDIERFPDQEWADEAVDLLRAAGIKAVTKVDGLITEGVPIIVRPTESRRARAVLDRARRFGRTRKKIKLPPEEGTLENLDMLIHDCRQYLMIATGELKSIEEEGVLELEEVTNDPFKLAIRLKRLKSQCMRQAGLRGLDWEHGGGLGF